MIRERLLLADLVILPGILPCPAKYELSRGEENFPSNLIESVPSDHLAQVTYLTFTTTKT